MDKPSNILRTFVNYSRKKFYINDTNGNLKQTSYTTFVTFRVKFANKNLFSSTVKQSSLL